MEDYSQFTHPYSKGSILPYTNEYVYLFHLPQKTRFTQGGNMINLTVSFEQNKEMKTNSTNSAGARLWAAADDQLLIDDRDGPTVERCRLLGKSQGWTGSFRRGVRRAECLQTGRQALSPESDPISQSHSLLLSAEKKRANTITLHCLNIAFWKSTFNIFTKKKA